MAHPQMLPQRALVLLLVLGALLSASHVAASESSSGVDALGHTEQKGAVTGRRTLVEGDAAAGQATVGAGGGSGDRRLIIGITATYARAFQVIYINHIVAAIRAAGTPFLWIVVEGEKKVQCVYPTLDPQSTVCMFYSLSRRYSVYVRLSRHNHIHLTLSPQSLRSSTLTRSF